MNFEEFIDVRFFEPTQGIDPKIQQIIDDKISHLTLIFNTRLYAMKKTNDKYYYQITTFEKLCQEGNIFITLKEMNALSIVQKLQIVENDAKIIWSALKECYGEGYFNTIISEEYGITPDY